MNTKIFFGYRMRNIFCALAVMLALAFVSCDDGTNSVSTSNEGYSNGVSLNVYSLSLTVGQSSVLTATVLPDSASQDVLWVSSDSGVATVVNGTVRGVSAGTAEIIVTAVADPSKTATCNVTVTNVSGPEPSLSYDMVYVPAGSYRFYRYHNSGQSQGNSETLTMSAFYIGKYEVTQALYESVTGENPSHFRGDNLPVDSINWYDAVEFCNKMSEKEELTPYYTIDKTVGSDSNNLNDEDPYKWLVTLNTNATGYRLPTEFQWAYAASGGDGSPGDYRYAGSNNCDDVAWYRQNSEGTTHAVGTKAPNGLGIYDMTGNVMEWCRDWYDMDGNSVPQSGNRQDPIGPSSGEARTARGGSWDSVINLSDLDVFNRSYQPPHFEYKEIGFRMVRP